MMQDVVDAGTGGEHRGVVSDIGMAEIKAVKNAVEVLRAAVGKIVNAADLLAPRDQSVGDI